MEKIKIPYEQLVKIVTDEFIAGADDAYLPSVQKTARGCRFLGIIFKKSLVSATGKYRLNVSGGLWFMFKIRKRVWVENLETNQIYKLNKCGHWKKFYKAVETACKMERINRSR